jgi:hypothetical protein
MTRPVGTAPLKRLGSLGLLVALVSIVAIAVMPGSAQDSKTQKLVFASAGFDESNRFWTIARPDHLQYDPFLETLLDVDPKTGEYTPRLAEKWQPSADYKEWTFFLRKGVPFHFGYGQFTAKDVVHSHAFMLRPEATATLAPFWRNVEEVKIVNDYQVVFRMKRPSTTMPYAASRAGDLRIVSKAQWDKEGIEGLDKRPAGLALPVCRKSPGPPSPERVDNHGAARSGVQAAGVQAGPGRGTVPALVLSGEAQIADMPRESKRTRSRRGMKISRRRSRWTDDGVRAASTRPGIRLRPMS